MPELFTTILASVVSAIVGGLLGGGIIWRFSVWAIDRRTEERMRTLFATIEALNAYGSRVNGLETVAMEARTHADEARANLERIEEVQNLQWNWIRQELTKSFSRPLENLQTAVGQLAAQVAGQSSDIRNLGERLSDLAGNKTPRS